VEPNHLSALEDVIRHEFLQLMIGHFAPMAGGEEGEADGDFAVVDVPVAVSRRAD
jgi:hypothetical protein